jgi:hypothetical protein
MNLPCYICVSRYFYQQSTRIDIMNESQLFQAARTMRSMGSFASAISEAYFVADINNRETLVQAFKGLFERAFDISNTNPQ